LDWRIAAEPIGNRQSQIDNPKTHPLPQVVLTSCHTDALSHTYEYPLSRTRTIETG